MSYAVFILVLGVLTLGVVKRPGIALAYILLFQGLNSLIFDIVDLSGFRYVITIVAIPALLIVHYGKDDFGKFSSVILNNGIIVGYAILLIYMFLYAISTSSHELNFFISFLFPGTILWGLGAAVIYEKEVYKDFFYGTIVFSSITFFTIILFKTTGVQDFQVARGLVGEYTGMSVITQGRMSGLWALFGILAVLRLSGIWRIAGGIMLIPAMYWLFLAGSRGPLVSLTLTLLFYLLLSKRRSTVLLYLTLVVFALGVGFFALDLQNAPLAARITDTIIYGSIESTQRFYRWTIFFQTLPDHFILGLGPGGWGKYIWSSADSYPHNIFIEFVLDYGIVGAITFLMIMVSAFWTAFRVIRNEQFNVYGHALVLSWVYYLSNTMVSGGFIYGNQPFFALTGLMVGLGIVSKYSIAQKPSVDILRAQSPLEPTWR